MVGYNLTPASTKEFAEKGREYVMLSMNPFASEKKKQEALQKLLSSLSEGTFKEVAPQFIMGLGFNKAKDFKNSESEADAFLARYPRMKPYRDLLLERIKEYRLQKKMQV